MTDLLLDSVILLPHKTTSTIRRRVLLVVLAIPLLLPVTSWATTWDEPWRSEVIENATSFGLYLVESAEGPTVTLTKVRHLAGKPTPETLELSGYSTLRLGSESSHDWQARLDSGSKYYLFLGGSASDGWGLPTPTAGADLLQPDGIVQATYRLSVHKAAVRAEIYELTQVCLFQVLHGRKCALDEVRAFVDDTLSQPVAELSPDASPATARRFFHQHAALETAAMLDLEVREEDFARYFASDFFHVQISALRYLASSPRPTRYREIAEFVCDDTKHPLSRGFGVLFLDRADARSAAETLKGCLDRLDGEPMSLVRLMDPRIGTYFPHNLEDSVRELVERWETP